MIAEEFVIPQWVKIEEGSNERFARFSVEPFERGYGTTVGNSMRLMRDELRANASLRAAYRVAGRTLIRNSGGGIVGFLPDFEICGRGLVGSFMAGEDVETAQEMADLEPP